MRAYSRVVNLATDKDCDHEHNTCKGEEGVRVRSTARKLMDASNDGSAGAEITGGEVVEVKACFIGAVGYVEQTFIESHLNEIASQIVKEGLGQADKDDDLKAIFARTQEVLGEPKTLARLLLLKRKAFEQESEVRVILIPRGRPDLRKGLPAGWRTDIARERAQQRCICIPFGPNKLFDEVTFDPRLRPLELKQRKECIKNLGYTGKFLDSPLYKPAHLRIEITLKPEVE